MKNLKHTPGEWTVHNFGPEGNKQTRIHSNNVTIAKIIQIDESEANAQLIAAAPTLLEALRKAEVAISYLQQMFVTMEKEHDHAAMMSGHARRTIREAIEKAIG